MINQSLYKDKLTTVNGILSVKEGPIEVMKGWYLIPGYSLYVINDKFEIMNLARSRMISVQKTFNNYPRVSLKRDDKAGATSIDLHRIVALAFMPIPTTAPGETMEVDHINGDRTDLRLENLEWVTKTENYVRGRRMKEKVKVKAFHVFFKKLSASAIYDTVEDVAASTQVDEKLLNSLMRTMNSYNDDNIVINIIETETCSGHKSPVLVEDGTDGSGFIVKSVTEAAIITGVPRPSINELLLHSGRPDAPYTRGYRFHRVGTDTGYFRRMTLGEALVARYIRFYDAANRNATVGWVLRNWTKNYIIAHREHNALTKLLSRGSIKDDKCSIAPVYKKLGTSELSDAYTSIMQNFNGDVKEWRDVINGKLFE